MATRSPAPASKVPAAPAPAGPPWPRDTYTGVAGTYIRDPQTGLRRPAGDAPSVGTSTPNDPADGQ